MTNNKQTNLSSKQCESDVNSVCGPNAGKKEDKMTQPFSPKLAYAEGFAKFA